MSEESVVPLISKPGIKRDGTRFEGDAYVDGEWVRWDRGLPRKIWGYRSINKYLRGAIRALSEYTQDRLTYVHGGSADRIERFYIDGSNNTSIITDRTPESGFTEDDMNLWQFTIATKVSAGVPNPLIVAQVAPNLDCVCNSDGGELFYGDLTGTDPLTPLALPTGGSATGGVVALGPYLFFFGNNGYIGWSIAGDPTDLSGTGSGAVNVTQQKIVAGLPVRGGPGNAPSGLFWSADSLIRAGFVGGDPVFSFDTISGQSSILSSRSVIEYDGIYYWAGSDRFLMFNGVVREIPNDMNQNFFFDTLNSAYRQKVFVTKVPRFGEIWWCYPKGTSTEPNHAVIYNIRSNCWYDTPLPIGGRAAGIFPTVFRRPLMSSATPYFNDVEYRVTQDDNFRITEDGDSRVTEESEEARYKFWVHEQGLDAIDGQSIQPILSYFETADIFLPLKGGPDNEAQVVMVEPDFVQIGDMTLTINGNRNARAPTVSGEPLVFPAETDNPLQEVVHPKTQRRQLRFRWESNTVGGDYQTGMPLAHIQPGDGRAT